MESMTPHSTLFEYHPGRRFFGRVPFGEEIFSFLERFCEERSIQAAVFSLAGPVSAFAYGTFDPVQKVFVTQAESDSADILSCSGNITPRDGKPVVQATAVLSDPAGRLFGGRLFPKTVAFAVEFTLLEISDALPIRTYDEQTGLFSI